MFSPLLDNKVQDFIRQHQRSDLAKLALQKNPFPEIPFLKLLDQISGLSKASEKLPAWHGVAGILYPRKVQLEQASSQATAIYKAGLISGGTLIDLTGGFGVDDAMFAKNFDEVTHCELDGELSRIVSHNLVLLGIDNVRCEIGDGLQILRSRPEWDYIYVDPSRRNEQKGKVFLLSDCAPNVPELLDEYFTRSKRVLVKASPIMDISAAVAQLKHVSDIHIVALNNEVREILFDLQKGSESYNIRTVNLGTPQPAWSFDPREEIEAPLSPPLQYLYEPNPAIMKSGGFGPLSRDYGLPKLHRHSHLFTSDRIVDFPGRVFRIDRTIEFDKKGQKELAQLKKANVAARNFPLDVASLRKRFKIADGGDVYCFFTTGLNEKKIALICSKIG